MINQIKSFGKIREECSRAAIPSVSCFVDSVEKVDKGVNCRKALPRILPGIQIVTNLDNKPTATETFHDLSYSAS